jgi:hypothetical protein
MKISPVDFHQIRCRWLKPQMSADKGRFSLQIQPEIGLSLAIQEIHPVSPLIHRQVGKEQPWCLVTHQPDATLILRYYRRRMWIKEI